MVRSTRCRCTHDLQLSTEIRRPEEDNVTQVAIERRQTVRADVRMRQPVARLHVRRQVTSGAQGQTVRLHRSVPIHIHNLTSITNTTNQRVPRRPSSYTQVVCLQRDAVTTRA